MALRKKRDHKTPPVEPQRIVELLHDRIGVRAKPASPQPRLLGVLETTAREHWPKERDLL